MLNTTTNSNKLQKCKSFLDIPSPAEIKRKYTIDLDKQAMDGNSILIEAFSNNLIITEEEFYYLLENTKPFYALFEYKLNYNQFIKVVIGMQDRFFAIYATTYYSHSEKEINEKVKNKAISQAKLMTMKNELLSIFSLETCYFSLKDAFNVKENMFCIEICEPDGEENNFFTEDSKKAKNVYDYLMKFGIGTDYFKYYRNYKMIDHYERFNIHLVHDFELQKEKFIKSYTKTKLSESETISIIKELLLFKKVKILNLLEITINFHEIYETNGSFILVFDEFLSDMNIQMYYQKEGYTINSVAVLWIEVLMTLEILRRNNIYLIDIFNFDLFRIKDKSKSLGYRATLIDFTKFEEINYESLDAYQVLLYETVKEMAVKFKLSFYTYVNEPEYRKKKKRISMICFKLSIGNYKNFEELILS